MRHENQWIRHLSALVLGAALLVASGAAAQDYVKDPAEVAPPIVIVGGEPPPAASEPAPNTEAPASTAPESVPQPAPATAQPPVTQSPPAADPGPPVLSIGLSGLLSGMRIGGEIDLHSMSGLDLALHLSAWLYVGARRIGVAFATAAAGDRYAIGGSPTVGFTWSLGEVLALFAEAGAALQWRFGDQLDGAIGIAPFAGFGARFRLADWISLALEGAAHVPVTDAFTLQNAVLPQGAVEVSGGLGVLFHIR